MKNEHLSADVLCSMQDVFAKLTNHDLGQSINGQQRILHLTRNHRISEKPHKMKSMIELV